MDARCAKCPEFDFQPEHKMCETVECPYFLITERQHSVFFERGARESRVPVLESLATEQERLSQISRQMSELKKTSKRSRTGSKSSSQSGSSRSVNNDSWTLDNKKTGILTFGRKTGIRQPTKEGIRQPTKEVRRSDCPDTMNRHSSLQAEKTGNNWSI